MASKNTKKGLRRGYGRDDCFSDPWMCSSAAALGDIGRHFPDTDPQYKGISVSGFWVCGSILLDENHFVWKNIDATIIAQRPKMLPHIPAMRENIAKALHIELEQINVKATTEDWDLPEAVRESPHRQSACWKKRPITAAMM